MGDMTADAARSHRFSKARRGAHAAEVAEFQQQVAATLAAHERTVARLEAELIELRMQAAASATARQEAEAQRAAILAGAREEERRIITAAHEQAEQLAVEAARELAAEKDRLTAIYNRVRTATSDLRSRFEDAVQSSTADIEVLSGLVELEAEAIERLPDLLPPETSIEVDLSEDDEETEERRPTGYERRLAGLKERLREAGEA